MRPAHAMIEWQCQRCGRWVPLDESHAHGDRRVRDRRMDRDRRAGGDRRKGDRRREMSTSIPLVSPSVPLLPRH